jgi:hypothetical protein
MILAHLLYIFFFIYFWIYGIQIRPHKFNSEFETWLYVDIQEMWKNHFSLKVFVVRTITFITVSLQTHMIV